MKNVILTFAMLFTVVVLAQNEAKKPLLEKEGELVKATYFHENGKVAQTGFYLNGKLQGEWKAYDAEGNKIAVGNYNQGKKTGKWFFWSQGTLSEVDYTDNRIVNATTWNNANSIVVNQ